MYTLLADKTRGLEEQALDFTQQLIRTPSPSLAEHEVARLVQQRMESLGYEKVFVDDFGNVIGVLTGREGQPTVLLCSHMDTADNQPDAWDESPYSGEVRDGILYGLGASDCKAGLAAQIYAGAVLRRAMLPLRGNVVVAATVSEERGGSPGLRYLMQQTLPSMDLRPDFAILSEPTGLSVYYGHDGSAVFEVLIEGSDQFQVGDATTAVFETFRNHYRAAASPGELEFQTLKAPRFQQDSGTAFGMINVSRRLPDTETVQGAIEQLKQEARAAAASVARVAVNVKLRKEERQLYTKRTTILEQRVEPWSLDPYHPLIARARHALGAAGCEVSCGKFQLPRLGMGTAGGVLVSEFNVPAIAFGPGAEATCHVPNESVPVDLVSQAIYGTAAIAHSLVGVPVCGWTLDEI